MATVEWEGYPRLAAGLARLEDPDAAPLMERWERTIVEGNRRGVLSGLDGDDRPMPPLKYRLGVAKRTGNRHKARFGTTLHAPLEGAGDNLTTAEYRRLTGPRLAPRGERSRSIANLMTQHGRDPSANYQWFAEGAWVNVVSRDGTPFLPFHFAGTRTLPRYDLRPVRPDDRRLAARQMLDWARDLLRF